MKRFFDKFFTKPSPVDTQAVQADIPHGALTCIGDLPDGDNSRSYFYRTESSKGWERFFSTDFEITLRLSQSQDAARNPALAQAAKNTGEARAFYYYDSEDFFVNQVSSHHAKVLNKENGFIFNYARDMVLCVAARYDTRCPALMGKQNYKDGTQGADACRLLIADPDDFRISREYIEIYLCGSWRKMPAMDDRTIVDFLMALEKRGAMCQKSAKQLLDILRLSMNV
ncbi:hypothetical protein ACKUFS_08855 [Pseudomonas cannabina]|uniref:Uncharacterized protein n=1 Tax=Pseudomonas syringae pv. maculicola str. ES4326 TaxID=629265 RepID=A0A8T8C224_PSEYM|nr:MULTISPECIES: hypothetical protein [Pseudomonas syringae group]QHE97283.1 hypothetical protein PMA4326_012085 [Pseudomonas syringae pv. maculicola str. ES4326]QQN24474.1 hypothetical protein JGS08_13250 [Pseudomonas cannabina pv. alisalensis]UBY97947.1 hypothetical protein LCG56_01950 [Pseudomonas cannabina pv. alisalensis]